MDTVATTELNVDTAPAGQTKMPIHMPLVSRAVSINEELKFLRDLAKAVSIEDDNLLSERSTDALKALKQFYDRCRG